MNYIINTRLSLVLCVYSLVFCEATLHRLLHLHHQPPTPYYLMQPALLGSFPSLAQPVNNVMLQQPTAAATYSSYYNYHVPTRTSSYRTSTLHQSVLTRIGSRPFLTRPLLATSLTSPLLLAPSIFASPPIVQPIVSFVSSSGGARFHHHPAVPATRLLPPVSFLSDVAINSTHLSSPPSSISTIVQPAEAPIRFRPAQPPRPRTLPAPQGPPLQQLYPSNPAVVAPVILSQRQNNSVANSAIEVPASAAPVAPPINNNGNQFSAAAAAENVANNPDIGFDVASDAALDASFDAAEGSSYPKAEDSSANSAARRKPPTTDPSEGFERNNTSTRSARESVLFPSS